MSRSDSYVTKQKDSIIKIIKNKKSEFTIKDIYSELNGIVGLTTIYRLVDKLVMEGFINKYIAKDNVTYYRYLEECDKENHFYLRCDRCGHLTHIDCDCIAELSSHIMKEHNFKLSKKNIIIDGTCSKCIKRENK